MIHHAIRHLFKSTHHAVKHSSRATNSIVKSTARVTPMAWLQSGKAHKHATSFWTKVAHRGFKFWS